MISGVLFFVFLIIFAEDFKNGFLTGLKNCSETVIPSVFPFLIAASLSGSGNIPKPVRKIASFFTEKLFNLPSETIFAFILGQTGGYLSGVKSANSLCETGRISESQAEKLMLFCINPGIGFAVNALGSIMLSSRNSGRIIFFSICISSVICGIISRFLPHKKITVVKRENPTPPFSQAVINSVSSGTFSLLTACAFICIFSGMTAVIEAYIPDGAIKTASICLLEITNGCIVASKEMSLPFISAMCSFGGICVHMQIFASADKFRIRLPLFYLFRIINAVLSFLICNLLLSLFPNDVQAMVNVTPEAALWSFSAPASVSLLFLSALLIFDLDNMYRI